MNRLRPLPARLAILLLLLPSAFNAAASSAGGEMADAANNFLQALSPAQQAQATYALADEERFDWHFIPKSRKGISLKEMSPAQQKLAQALLSSGLSHRGYAKAVTIMSLEQILADLEQSKGPRRDPDLYFFTVFGKPGPADAWGWRVEGHHLSLNFVVRGDRVLSATPTFFGSNPAEIKDGPRRGLRVLGSEEDLGRQFVKSLTGDQLKLALIAIKAPNDIITGNSRKAQLLNPPGLPAAQMTAQQKELLLNLVRDYAVRHRAEVAEEDLHKIQEAGFGKVRKATETPFNMVLEARA